MPTPTQPRSQLPLWRGCRLGRVVSQSTLAGGRRRARESRTCWNDEGDAARLEDGGTFI